MKWLGHTAHKVKTKACYFNLKGRDGCGETGVVMNILETGSREVNCDELNWIEVV